MCVVAPFNVTVLDYSLYNSDCSKVFPRHVLHDRMPIAWLKILFKHVSLLYVLCFGSCCVSFVINACFSGCFCHQVI